MRGHNLHGRAWVAIAAVLAVLLAHAALLGFTSRRLSAALIAGVIGAVVLKVVLKYVWSNLRR